MAPDLFLEGVPASSYDLTSCTVEQLDLLESRANEIINRVQETKKGALLIASLSTRHSNRQFVRCTEQSVRTTASARYEPETCDFDMSGLSIACFVGLITYLPLPGIKGLIANDSATGRAEQIWAGTPLEPRWAIYYERLTSVNGIWARQFLKEVQSHAEGPFVDGMQAQNVSAAIHGGSVIQDMTTRRTINDVPLQPHQANAIRNQIEKTSPCSNELLLLKVIKAKRTAWGTAHPTTFESIALLADLYVAQQRLTEAKVLLLQAFRDRKATQAGQIFDICKFSELLAEVDCQLDSRQEENTW